MHSSVIVCECTKNSANYIYKYLQSLYDMPPLFKKSNDCMKMIQQI